MIRYDTLNLCSKFNPYMKIGAFPHVILGGAAFTELVMYLDAKFPVSNALAQIQSVRQGQEFSKGHLKNMGTMPGPFTISYMPPTQFK